MTEPEQVVRWFTDRVELDARPGGKGTLVFEHMANIAALVVETVDPPHRFTFRWGHPDGEVPVPGNSVLVEFTLTAEGDERTRLRVAETGLDAIGWPDDDKARYADEHRDGRANFLGRLVDLFASPVG
ncbi:MAG TPA: SRPBCC domain-containing protein [Acidimicrobiales bacterium]|nr:SRPBCC domain-containing protein [Acidimicrobiales bacterium]